MAAIDGKNRSIGVVMSGGGDSYGTEKACTERLVVESFNYSENASELSSNSIGAAKDYTDDAQRGATAPSVSGNLFPNFQVMGYLLAQLLGTSGAGTEQTGGQSDYLHEIRQNSTLNNRYLTLAGESSSSTTVAFPSVTLSEIGLSCSPGAYLDMSFSGLADELELSSSTNTNAVLDALTVADSERVVVEYTDQLLINAQGGGALSGSDRVNFTDLQITLTRPQEFVPEVKGSAGNGAPGSAGLQTGVVQVTLKEGADNTWLAAAQAGTEYKAQLELDGSQIGSGVNKQVKVMIPRMKLLATPDFNFTDPGRNPMTLTFICLEASSAPTGMTGVTAPAVDLINERSGAYIA